jgi:hypothetical protein
MGVRHGWMLAVPFAAWTIAAATAYATAKSRWLLRSPIPFTTIASCVAAAATSLLFGPYVLLPVVVGVNAMGYLLTADRDGRRPALVLSALAFLVPALLGWAGWHPVSASFDGESMRIGAGAFVLSSGLTQALLFVVHAALLAGAAAFAARYRDALARAEMRERMQAWQLEQLAPRDARGIGKRSPRGDQPR